MRADQVLSSRVEEFGAKRALHWVDRDRSLTYGEASDSMNRAATVFRGFGVAEGSCVGVLAHPGLDYVTVLLGAWRLGAAAAVVDLRAKNDFRSIMSRVSPDAIVYTNDHFDFVRPIGAEPSSVRVYAGMDGPQELAIGWPESLASADPLESSPEPGDASDEDVRVAMRYFSAEESTMSAITHGELLRRSSRVVDRLGMESDDITMCPTPMSQPFHLISSILPSLAVGGTAGMLKSWQPSSGWQSMEDHGTTILCGSPTHCADLLDVARDRGARPSSLRMAVTYDGDGVDELVNGYRDELEIDLAVI